MLQVSRLSAVILCASASAVFAAPSPPTTVYRVDTRPPEEIFVYGFRGWGNDHNIVAHVNGHTCTGSMRTSVFISTMANYNMVDALVENHLQQRNENVYSIRADSNFYNAPAAIDYIQSFVPASPLSLASLRTARRVAEWVAIDRIPPENISSVLVRRRNGANDIYRNIMFEDIPTHANERVYSEFAAQTLRHYRFPLQMPDNTTTWLSACFSGCPSGSSSRAMPAGNLSAGQDQCIEQRVYRVENALAIVL